MRDSLCCACARFPRVVPICTVPLRLHNGVQLSGTIPSSLGLQTNLTYLRLSNNGFSGQIPASLGALTDLQFLYLHDNALTGTFPATFSRLASVQRVLVYVRGPL